MTGYVDAAVVSNKALGEGLLCLCLLASGRSLLCGSIIPRAPRAHASKFPLLEGHQPYWIRGPP